MGEKGNGQSEIRSSGTDLKHLLEAYERGLILEALAASGGHQRRTAARLGILPTTLHEKMKRLGLLKPRPQSEGTSEGARDYAAVSMRQESRQA